MNGMNTEHCSCTSCLTLTRATCQQHSSIHSELDEVDLSISFVVLGRIVVIFLVFLRWTGHMEDVPIVRILSSYLYEIDVALYPFIFVFL